MSNILFIDACVRENSRTYELAQAVLSRLEGQVHEINLEQTGLSPLTGQTLALRDKLLTEKDYNHPMLKYAREFAEADTIVVAAPYWDLLFPASLRVYFEHVTVSGVTFYYNDAGIPQSLCKAKKLIYATTAGGPIFGNLGYEYVKAVATGFFGISDVRCVKAENLDIWGADVAGILEAAKKNIDVN